MFFAVVGDISKALEAAASYLLFFPDDETMNENKEYYLNLPDAKEEMFKPRDEALRYFERQESEQSLLKFIEQNFHFEEGEISEAEESAGNANDISDS